MPQLIGRTIENVRPMTDDELRSFGWTLSIGDCPAVIELDDGSILLPSRDPEENGPGVLVGEDGDGEGFWVPQRSDEQGDGVYDPDAEAR